MKHFINKVLSFFKLFKNKNNNPNLIDEFFKPYSNLIGIGGGGSNIVEYLSLQYKNDYNPLIINSDKQALNSKKVSRKIHLQKQSEDNNGCGSNEYCGFSLVNYDVLKRIKLYIGDNQKICIVATLGGGVGSGSTKAIVKYLVELGVEVHLVLVYPFSWEGNKKSNRADDTIQFVKIFCQNVYIVQNDDIKSYLNNSMKECFTLMNEKIHNIVKDSLWN